MNAVINAIRNRLTQAIEAQQKDAIRKLDNAQKRITNDMVFIESFADEIENGLCTKVINETVRIATGNPSINTAIAVDAINTACGRKVKFDKKVVSDAHYDLGYKGTTPTRQTTLVCNALRINGYLLGDTSHHEGSCELKRSGAFSKLVKVCAQKHADGIAKKRESVQ